MNVDLNKLEALAREVSKQDCDNWRVDICNKVHVLADGEGCIGTYNLLTTTPDVAEYIAAANPVTVLNLIAEIHRLQTRHAS